MSKITVIVQTSHPWTTPNGGQVGSGESVEVEETAEVQRDLDAGIISIKISPAAESIAVDEPEEAQVTKPRATKARFDSQEIQ